jgi:HSP20 family protein
MSTELQKSENKEVSTLPKFWTDMDQIRSEMEGMMREMFAGNWFNFPSLRRFEQRMQPLLFQPSLNVRKDDKDLVVEAALPGIDKKDIHLTVTRDALVLRGEFKKEAKTDNDKIYRSEMEYSSFYRSLQLPVEVDSTKVKAELKDGVLRIRMPLLHPENHQQVKVEVK